MNQWPQHVDGGRVFEIVVGTWLVTTTPSRSTHSYRATLDVGYYMCTIVTAVRHRTHCLGCVRCNGLGQPFSGMHFPIAATIRQLC